MAYRSTSTIDGGEGDDSIHNIGNETSIDGGKGNDFIENNKGNLAENGGVGVTILGGEDKDTIKNNGSCVTIDGGTDADSITNERTQGLYAGNYTYSGDEVSINGGNGNNTINNGLYTGKMGSNFYTNVREFQVEENSDGGKKVTITAAENDDYIFNRGDEASINAGNGKNTIVNGKFISGTERISALDPTLFRIYDSVKGGDKVTIETGTGNDTIHNFNSSEVSINAGGGVNLVSVSGNSSNITIKGGTGTDSIIFYTPKNFTNVDANADEIPNDSRFGGSNVLIETSGEKNFISISSSWSYVTINGSNTSNNVDVIFNDGQNALIKGNAGNDYIRNTSDYAVIFGGDDGDIIENYGNNAFIEGDNASVESSGKIGDYIYTDKGNDVTVDGGNGNDLIEAWNDIRASISGGDGNDIIYLYRMHASDYANIVGELVKIVGLEILSKWKYVSDFSDIINALQSSKDILSSFYTAENIASFLKGSAIALVNLVLPISSVLDLANHIVELSSESTINGGAGDDTIVSDGLVPRIFKYKNDDGKDVYYHFNDNKLNLDSYLSTLHITQGQISAIEVNDTDVIFKIGEGSIKLVDGANKKFKLLEEDGNLTTRAYGKDENSGEVVCSIFGSSAGEVIKDNTATENIRYVIYGEGGDDELHGKQKNDTLYGGNEIDNEHGNTTGNGKDTLRGFGGNDLLYGDSHSLLDGGADDDTIYSGRTISFPNSEGYLQTDGNKNTVYGGTGNDEINNFGNGTSIEGGADNDYIYNHGQYIIAEGRFLGESGYDVTIVGGTGDDYISNSGNKVLFKYNAATDTTLLKVSTRLRLCV